MVLLTVLIRDLAARFRRDVDVVTSGPWSEPLLRGQPGVGEILSVRSRKTPYWLSLDQQRVVRRLRARGAGPTWFCDGNQAAKPMLSRAGIGAEFIVDVRDHGLLPGEHATEQWHRLAKLDPEALRRPRGGASPSAWPSPLQSPAPSPPQPPRQSPASGPEAGCYLAVSGAQQAEFDAWFRLRAPAAPPFVAVQMGNKRTMRRGLRRLAVNSKYWPNERWVQVLRHVHARHPGHALVLLGTGPEYALNQEVLELARLPRVYNVADDLPIPRLLALLARADALVTVDSGPAHAAAAVGCPQIVLFGKALPSLYTPRGVTAADVTVLTGQVDGAPDMLGIDASAVIAAWDALRLRSGAGAAGNARPGFPRSAPAACRESPAPPRAW